MSDIEDTELPLIEKVLVVWMIAGMALSPMVWALSKFFTLPELLNGYPLYLIVCPMLLLGLSSQGRMEVEHLKRRDETK